MNSLTDWSLSQQETKQLYLIWRPPGFWQSPRFFPVYNTEAENIKIKENKLWQAVHETTTRLHTQNLKERQDRRSQLGYDRNRSTARNVWGNFQRTEHQCKVKASKRRQTHSQRVPYVKLGIFLLQDAQHFVTLRELIELQLDYLHTQKLFSNAIHR